MDNPFSTISKENTSQYTHFISLGYFCSVAMELERYGFRNASYPFDWLVTPAFDRVIDAIDNSFENFLDYDVLEQDTVKRQIYYDRGYKCAFVHDFDRFRPLAGQLPEVTDKFKRRIDRFYRDITEPTLFVRYINDENTDARTRRSDELLWIESNLDRINSSIRRYNANNDILWIANSGVTSDLIHIYNVDKDPNDTVARRPFEQNHELGLLFDAFDMPGRDGNLQRYLNKERRKKSKINRIRKRVSDTIRDAIHDEYVHVILR